MSEKRLMNWAVNLSEEVPYEEDVQAIYDFCINYFRNRREYFENLQNEFLLDLIIYIYSYKKTKDFKLAKHIIDNKVFLGLLSTSMEDYTIDCDYCDGNGHVECDSCDGSGQQACGECDGEGTVSCDTCGGEGLDICGECDGEGEDEEGDRCTECNGSGAVTCEDCGGTKTLDCSHCDNGYNDCYNCDGSGSMTCDTCDGRGELDTDEWKYKILNICSWSNPLNNLCEIRMNTFDPICEDDELDEKFKDFITLEYDDDFHAELVSDIEMDKYYCFELDNTPKLLRKRNFAITPGFDDTEARNYID
jgi:hypothetical protein